jgi:hypothetical protein
VPDYFLKTYYGLCLWYGYFNLVESTAEPVSHARLLQHYHVSDPGIVVVVIVVVVVVVVVI